MPKRLIEDSRVGLQWPSHSGKSIFSGEKQGVPCWSSSTLILEIHCKEFSTIKVIWWQGIWPVKLFEESLPIDLIPKGPFLQYQYPLQPGQEVHLLRSADTPIHTIFSSPTTSGKGLYVPWEAYRLESTSLYPFTRNDANLVSLNR